MPFTELGKVLVVAPHTDDELFGIGGFLLKMKDKADVKIVVTSCSERYLVHLDKTITKAEQLDEFFKSARQLSNQPADYLNIDVRLEDFPLYKTIRWVDFILHSYKPNTIFVPEASYHQEHKITYDACIAALRPTTKISVKNIFTYEIPTSTWTGNNIKLHPNVYIDIEDVIEKKVEVFKECYKLQYTSTERVNLSEQGIRSYAAYRGSEINIKYAECFNLVRAII